MRWIGLIAVLLLSSFAVAEAPADVLMKADREFARQTAAHRLEGWMSVITDASVLFSEHPVVGAEAIRAACKKRFDDPDFHLEWEPTKAEIFPSGDLGYTVGRYQVTFRNSKGGTEHQSGTYLTVWRKEKDGSWKLAADGGASDPTAR